MQISQLLLIGLLAIPFQGFAGYEKSLVELWAAGEKYDEKFEMHTVDKAVVLKSPTTMVFGNYIVGTITSEAIEHAKKIYGNAYEHICLVKKDDEQSNKLAKKMYNSMTTMPQMECDIDHGLIDLEILQSEESRQNLKNFTIIPIKHEGNLDLWIDVLNTAYGRKDAFKAITKPFLKKRDTLLFLGLKDDKPVAAIQAFLGAEVMMLCNLVAPNKDQGWALVKKCFECAYYNKTIQKAIAIATPKEEEILKSHFRKTTLVNFYTNGTIVDKNSNIRKQLQTSTVKTKLNNQNI